MKRPASENLPAAFGPRRAVSVGSAVRITLTAALLTAGGYTAHGNAQHLARTTGQTETPRVKSSESVADNVRRIVEAEARHAGFSGTVLVARGGQVLYEGAFGHANREFAVPNTLQTTFNTGSITKTFTALATVKLIEQGLLRADDPVAKFLPDWPGREKDIITVHQLLTHTSGLYDYANDENVVFTTLFKRGVRNLVPYVYGPGLQFAPGTDVEYSSGGYILLGAIIEKVSGMTFADYIRERILKPARMEHTMLLDVEDVVRNKAVGYKRTGPNTYQNRTLYHFPGSPAGGLYSTAGDLLNCVQRLLDGTLISARSLELLLAPKSANEPGRGRAAYGWWVDRIGDREIVYHEGGTPGFSSSVYIIPDLSYTAVVLSNTFRGTTGITDAINAAVTGGNFELADANTYDLRRAIDLHSAGQTGEARLILDRIVAGGQPSRQAYSYAAVVRIAQNTDLREALTYLDRAIALTPPRATAWLTSAWYRKGEAHEKLNEPADAAACYRKCLALDSRYQRAADALARVKSK